MTDGEHSVFTHRYSSASMGDEATGVAETVGSEIIDDALR